MPASMPGGLVLVLQSAGHVLMYHLLVVEGNAQGSMITAQHHT